MFFQNLFQTTVHAKRSSYIDFEKSRDQRRRVHIFYRGIALQK